MGRVTRRTACLAALIALTVAAPASAGTNSYALAVSPQAVPGGSTVTMTATLTNETAHRVITGASLFWPSPLQVVSASVPAPGGATLASSCSHGTQPGPCVQIRSLSLTPGQSEIVTMSVQTPAACSTGAYAWSIDTKPKGLTLDTANSSLTTAVDAACALKFATEPHSIVVGQSITGTDYDPTGAPVTVDVVDQNGNVVTNSTAPVTVSLANNPGNATLAGTTTVNAVGGVATFSDLSLNAPDTGYTLTATSSPLTSATSTAFDAQNAAVSCSASNSCTTTVGNSAGSFNVAATSTGPGELVGSVNPGAPLTCPGYTTNDPNSYYFLTSQPWGKVVTITITNPINLTGDGPDNDADDAALIAGQEICFQAPYEFTTNAGTPAPASILPDGSTVYTGLLPDCPLATGPCINRHQSGEVPDEGAPTGWDIVLVADIPAGLPGDPHMR